MAAPDPAVNTLVVGADPKTPPLGGEFDPAVADCGYRAPLTPRLARSHRFYRRRRAGPAAGLRRRSHVQGLQPAVPGPQAEARGETGDRTQDQ